MTSIKSHVFETEGNRLIASCDSHFAIRFENALDRKSKYVNRLYCRNNNSEGLPASCHDECSKTDVIKTQTKIEKYSVDIKCETTSENNTIGENSSSFELHLSPDTEEEEISKNSEDGRDITVKTEAKEELLSESDCLPKAPSVSSAEQSKSDANSGGHSYQNSPDMFKDAEEIYKEDSQPRTCSSSEENEGREPMEELCFQELGQPLDEWNSQELRKPLEECSSQELGQPLEEWSSQELREISRSLRVRSLQVKRLLMSVIRKRQMADESLASFKKRLKKF